jgi:CubicO group peptidase (beta-lactamase class C family)
MSPSLLVAAAVAQAMPAPAPPPARPAVLAPAVQAEIARSRYAGARLLAFAEGSRAIAKAAGFSGEFAMGHLYRGATGPASPVSMILAQNADGSIRQANQRWRWASVTKQVTAVLVMQEVAGGRIRLDAPVSTYLPDFRSANAGKITIRQLLRHQSGLPDPSATPAASDGVPAFYRPDAKVSALDFCAGPITGEPGGRWTYNNCDYLVAGAVLEAVTGKSWPKLVEERITAPLRLERSGVFPSSVPHVPGTAEGKPEPTFDLARYGASGAMYGTPSDLVRFDVALFSGKLLPEAARQKLWDGQPSLGFMALGQWVFSAPLRGCDKPQRIVERRGAIGGVEIRNIILPDLAIAMVLFSDRSGFDFGELWQGKGFTYDMLSLAACPTASAPAD